MTGYADVGPKLVERGFAAIPIMPGTKQPGYVARGAASLMPDWTRYAGRLPTSFEVDHWSLTAPAFGIGLVMGAASGDLIGIDIDVDDPAIIAAIKSVIGDSPARKMGQKGETLFFRAPGVASVSFDEWKEDAREPSGWKRGRRLVDIIGPGRQTVLPPTVHPDTGTPYRWIGYAALDALDLDDIPELPADIAEQIGVALAPFGYIADRQSKPRLDATRPDLDDDKPHRRLNNAAMADLDAWVPKLGLFKLKRRNGGYVAVASWRSSSTGRSLEKRGANLKIHPDGIVDFHDGERRYTPINLVMAAWGCDQGQAFTNLAEWLGMVDEPIELDARPTMIVDEHVVDAETGEILDAEPTVETPKQDFDDDDLQVPGLVGDIADWIMRTSPKPIRLFAVAAALSAVGTLAARRVYTGTPRSGTNLYIMTIAGTGAGKERPQEAVRQVLDAVGSMRLHAAETSSAASLGMRMDEKPAHVQIIDEIDRVLRKVSHKHASSQEAELLQAYCSIWGKNLGSWQPTGVTTRGDIDIKRPSLGIFGATTFHAFYEQMRARMLANGFLNRFLVLPRFERVVFNPKVEPEDDVPERIVDHARKLFYFQDVPPETADVRTFMGQSAFIHDSKRPPELFIVPMTPEAEEIYQQCRDRDEAMLRASDENPLLEAWSRGSEMTKRIALIVACGRYADIGLEGVAIDDDDMRFAKKLVDWSISLFVQGLEDHMSENDYQSNSKSVLGYIRKGGKDGITRSKLYRCVDNKMNARDLDAIILSLVEAGRVVVIQETSTSLVGRPKKTYKAM